MDIIKTLLVDDHKMIRDGIKSILNNDKNISVVAEFGNGVDAIKYLERNDNIDVVILDINMPELNGISTTEIITKMFKSIKIVALTMHDEEAYITKMLKAGALGYVLKDSGGEKLIQAVKTVYQGEKYYSNEVSVTLIDGMLNGNKEKETSTLSTREIDVLKNIVEGLTNKEIADLLNISKRTVETHRRNIMYKLELKNTAEMVQKSIRNGII